MNPALKLMTPFLAMNMRERARELARNGTDVVHLDVGEPDFNVHPFIVEAMKEALDGIVARNIRTSGEYQLTDALAAMLEMGVEFRSAAIEDWLDCGKPETLLETNRKLLQIQTRNCSPQLVNCRLTPPYYIGDNVRLSNCSIGPNVSIFSNVEAADSEISDAVIGEATRIRNSKLTRTLIGRHCAVKDFSGSLNLGDYSEVGTL